MFRNYFVIILSIFLFITFFSCESQKESKMKFIGAQGEVTLMTLDPGHFHAALVQKNMFDQVSPTVYVYASAGQDVADHLQRIEGFNTRAENPTHWDEKVYTGQDFLEKMLKEKPGNVLVISGNNMKKTEYIKAAVDVGLNVLADKPICIDQNDFELLKLAFESAEKNSILLYDIMTERYEISTILQKEMVNNPAVFGELQKGTPDNPAVIKESVHHLFKYVAGNPIKRPAWYFDVNQQGEGIVDVTTHLVDLIMWECFPEQIIDYTKDIEVLNAKRWATMVSQQQFEKVTRLPDFPNFLKEVLDENGVLPLYCNGDIIYKIRGVHAKVSVIWNFQAPEGSGDTHFSIMRGSKADVIIRQGKEQNYRPELYIEAAEGINPKALDEALKQAITDLQSDYPGVEIKQEDNKWHVLIPDKFRVGHEAHFGQVTEKYLRFLVEGKLPGWEVPNMIAKYYTTTKALELANQ